MTFIGLTQRVEYVESHKETRDCLDQDWHSLSKKNKFSSLPIPNDPDGVRAILKNITLDGLILTGGNDISSIPNAKNTSMLREETENYLMDYCKKNNKPLLGVCRGFQMMNLYFGGSLSKVKGHANTQNEIILSRNEFVDEEVIKVNSYHNFGIKEEDLSKDLEAFARSSDGTIEAAFHRDLNWIGIMWHPERNESKIDSKILKYLFN